MAVLGPDGSGKSTLIERLKECLDGAVAYVQVFHLRAPLRGRRGSAEPVTDPHGRAAHPLWLSWFKIAFYVFAYGLGYLVKVRPHLARSAVVFFDRYYDDLLVDPRRYRYGGPMKLAWLARRFIPRPDLVLILDVPVEELIRRKREVSLEELRRQRAAYRGLGDTLPAGVLLDGSQPVDRVARTACDIILAHLRGRAHA